MQSKKFYNTVTIGIFAVLALLLIIVFIMPIQSIGTPKAGTHIGLDSILSFVWKHIISLTSAVIVAIIIPWIIKIYDIYDKVRDIQLDIEIQHSEIKILAKGIHNSIEIEIKKLAESQNNIAMEQLNTIEQIALLNDKIGHCFALTCIKTSMGSSGLRKTTEYKERQKAGLWFSRYAQPEDIEFLKSQLNNPNNDDVINMLISDAIRRARG
jgi:hypothetical protein